MQEYTCQHVGCINWITIERDYMNDPRSESVSGDESMCACNGCKQPFCGDHVDREGHCVTCAKNFADEQMDDLLSALRLGAPGYNVRKYLAHADDHMLSSGLPYADIGSVFRQLRYEMNFTNDPPVAHI